MEPLSYFEQKYTNIEYFKKGDDGSKIYKANTKHDGRLWYVKCKDVTK